MVVKGTKTMCPACEMATWGLGYDDTTFNNSTANTKTMVIFSAQRQAELQRQEGMLLLSLHQTHQFITPQQEESLFFILMGIVIERKPWANTLVILSWWLGNAHARLQAPNSSRLESFNTPTLPHQPNVLATSKLHQCFLVTLCNYLSAIRQKGPGAPGCRLCPPSQRRLGRAILSSFSDPLSNQGNYSNQTPHLWQFRTSKMQWEISFIYSFPGHPSAWSLGVLERNELNIIMG